MHIVDLRLHNPVQGYLPFQNSPGTTIEINLYLYSVVLCVETTRTIVENFLNRVAWNLVFKMRKFSSVGVGIFHLLFLVVCKQSLGAGI